MLCLGNICRSPLAEGILKKKIEDLSLADWSVDSAGTGNWHVGQKADPRSAMLAREKGVEIESHRAMQLEAKHFEEFDQIWCMDLSNLENAKAIAPSPAHAEKAILLLDFAFPGEQKEVPDPYFDNSFRVAYKLMEAAIDAALTKHTS